MAPSPLCLLRHFHRTSATHHRHHLHLHLRRRLLVSPLFRHFSSSSSSPLQSESDNPNPNPNPNSSRPSSLSARLSFVFDKIDEIEKDRSDKDHALQRIRAWRESKNPKPPDHTPPTDNPASGLGFSPAAIDAHEVNSLVEEQQQKLSPVKKHIIEVAHPWPEWIELMERLVHQNYFDHRRKDEDKMLDGLGSADLPTVVEEDVFDFTRDWRAVQTAMLNFGRDRFDIFRSLSRQDIQVLVGYGCPSADKKVVFSSKLLRKHANLDEGDVCSSCSLRNSCERAYLVTNKDDEARTIDVMRVLLTYGFDPINGSVENKSLLKQKSVKKVVRKLLHDVVRLSAVPIDPNLPPPVIKPRPPKVKQPPPPPKKRIGRDDVEMKKGDWLCPMCNFMNFAKNAVCLQCDAKRPKRELLPGEWECPQCDFLNYRRNKACFNCEHKRPPDEYTEDLMRGKQQRPVTRLEKRANKAELSNAWNFDFDDDESDGADVAAFEYGDPNAMHEDSQLDSEQQNARFSKPGDNLYRVYGAPRSQGYEHQKLAQINPKTGFDDFDDDEDDNIDSYEVDNHNINQRQESSPVRFSDVEEGYSESEGDDDDDLPRHRGASSRSTYKRGVMSNSQDSDMDFDSDEDIPVHPKWKSSHVADSGHRGRGSHGPPRRSSFDSDDDNRLVFGSDDDDDDDYASKRGRVKSRARGFRRGDDFDSNQNRRQNGSRDRDSSRGSSGQRGFKRGGDFDSNPFRRQNNGADFDDRFGGSPRNQRFNKRDPPRMGGGQRGGNFKERGSRNGGYRRPDESADKWSDPDYDRPRRPRINVR